MLHYDAGSLLTLDLMLSHTTEFTGGCFTTPQVDGSLRHHRLERGDAVLFVSHKYHHVTPVESGKRTVLVLEVWRGPARTCPHRCPNPEGACHFAREGEESMELLPSCSECCDE